MDERAEIEPQFHPKHTSSCIVCTAVVCLVVGRVRYVGEDERSWYEYANVVPMYDARSQPRVRSLCIVDRSPIENKGGVWRGTVTFSTSDFQSSISLLCNIVLKPLVASKHSVARHTQKKQNQVVYSSSSAAEEDDRGPKTGKEPALQPLYVHSYVYTASTSSH